jgi:alkanesulfonate monooxygenase SsuD/methylene tetrahydromethanopterin reductase-like flavin-dependent oxidoreductase (luciferase family)
MLVGLGLPNYIPAVGPTILLDWARIADGGLFSSLCVLDRLVYDSYEPIALLSAAAVVTKRIRLATAIAIGPLRNSAVLAKSALTIDALSGGRFVLGVAVGARQDDYEVAGIPFASRGILLDDQLRALRNFWSEGLLPVSSASSTGPPLMVGGIVDGAFTRMARFADGYIHGGGTPGAFARCAEKAHAAWFAAGRPGRPRLYGQAYYALGTEAVQVGAAFLRHYYAFTGPFRDNIVQSMLTTPQAIVQLIRSYEKAGCDELFLLPTVGDLRQVEFLIRAISS